MDENRVDEFLEHHGIKGQRWGIRRTPEQLGHKVSKLKKKTAKLEQKTIDKEKKANKYSAKYHKNYNKAFKYLTEGENRKARKFFKKAKKWNKKNARYVRYVNRARQKIYDNEQLMKVYQNTIKAINSGQIKKGESWVENFLMMYKGSLDDED